MSSTLTALSTSVSMNTALHAASSMVIHGPPKGHPVPLFMSTCMESRLAISSVMRTTCIHWGERKGRSFLSLPFTPYSGVISTVLMPWSFSCPRFHSRLRESTADPSHHHRVPAYVVIPAEGSCAVEVSGSAVSSDNARRAGVILFIDILNAVFYFPINLKYSLAPSSQQPVP